MQTTRKSLTPVGQAKRQKARQAAYRIWVAEGGRVMAERKPVPRTEKQKAADLANLMQWHAKAAEQRQAEQLALNPDYRPGVAAMRARIAEWCGELQPYTHKQGWTL